MQTSGTESEGQPSTTYATSVGEAVVSAYYPRLTAAADAARSRAQGAFGIASAIGLFGAGLLVNLSTVSVWQRLLGAVALSAWLTASALYIRAVATPISTEATAQPDVKSDVNAFVRAVLTNAAAEREAIDRRQSLATRLAMVAVVLTAVTALSLLLVPRPQEHFEGTVALSTGGIEALAKLCPRRPRTVSGSLDVSSLGSKFLIVKASPGICQEDSVDLRLSSDEVVGIARHQ